MPAVYVEDGQPRNHAHSGDPDAYLHDVSRQRCQGGCSLSANYEGYDEEQGISIGRSYRDAPEIDGMIFIEGDAVVGEIVPVRITGAMAYDLTGVLPQ